MQTRGRRKVRRGLVTRDKMDKTIVVKVETRVLHSLYKKYIKKSNKFYAHDEKNDARIGDVVEIIETRPLSRTKCWRLLNVVSRSIESNVEVAGEKA
jgi:small subunit ribosomal protein S17